MQIWNYSLSNLVGIIFTLLTICVETIKGGRCTGAWGGEHSCFGGKRSDPSMGTGREMQAERNPLTAYFINQQLRRPYNQIQTNDRDMSSRGGDYFPSDSNYPKRANESPQYRVRAPTAPRYDVMPDRMEERFEDAPFAPNSVADDTDETEQEIMQMWQRVRERLLDQKAHEVLQELKTIMEEQTSP